ncbi:hypothetical protein GFL88_19360 [Rhizobium leguminosarum bv. viciae]|uniref:hypothetical protein n=1 Tax=Rhizobium leguminosarum TaxID=384 RepID=UPI0014414D37|nr:hypothetical protein [Rhizobium leguminosarum]NKK65649.1 hypothetical protein [Rhizobium leguminosarum bv. viciae]
MDEDELTDERPQIVLNYDALLETLRKAVRRSVVMMGIGVNAAETRPHVPHALAHDGGFGIQLVPEEVDNETKEHFADEFGKWVRANGLRELLESFSIYLQQLYFALYVIRWHTTNAPDKSLITPERFERRGIADQIGELAKVLEVDDRSKLILASLNQARNCYAHRQGKVGHADLETDRMVVTWNRLAFSIREPDGNVIPETEIFNRVLERGGTMLATFVAQERAFALGDELILQKHDLKEICLNVLQLGEAYYNQAVQAAIDAGLLHPQPASSPDGK